VHNLSKEEFDRLLAWLDDDRDRAALRYEEIRQWLIVFFTKKGFSEVAEELADKTIDRVAGRVTSLENQAVGQDRFFAAMAELVLFEHKYEQEHHRPADHGLLAPVKKGIVTEDEDLSTESINKGTRVYNYLISESLNDVLWQQFMLRRRRVADKKSLRSRVVSTGFSSTVKPDNPIDRKISLKSASIYYFWFEIGKAQKGSIETTSIEIPPVPANATLTVVLFTFKDSLEVLPKADVGLLELQGNHLVRVIRQPQEELAGSALLDRRLFFPVRTPAKAGVFRMRCNIYWEQTLLQSRLVQARVTTSNNPRPSKNNALSSVVDYKISRQLDPAHITKLNGHRMSILLNANKDGTHSFHFYGAKGALTFKQDDVRFDPGELEGMLDQARGTLRLASWGNAAEWQDSLAYRYKDRQPNLDRLKADLINLAMWGYEFYTQIRARLAGGEDAVETFEELLLQPGNIQFALKESARYILPAALIYDQPLDTGADRHDLCKSFVKAFQQKEPLENLECIKGNCPTREDITTVCPSGFWGFRHSIGLPLSVQSGSDIAPEILVNGNLKMAVGVATDLELQKSHLAAMHKLRSKLTWNDADNRDRVFQLLKDSPHLVYFYCHGGLLRNAPYLQFGPKEKPSRIQRSNFYAHKIVWSEPRPLVFINGCHTTAVAPTQALEFITPLITYSRCAGVIGTEITIFEQLATVFAEDCLGRFSRGEPIGQAIRNARLKLLKEGNPLGLVYIPFVLSGLTLVDKTPANSTVVT
jgi:hypothetical protein